MASTDKKNVISSLIESGKAKGKLSTKDITDALEELDYDVEQVDKLYSMLEGQNIEIVEEGASLDDDLDKLDLEGEDGEDALDLSFVDGVNIDPGGQPGPDQGRREVRPHQGLQVLHICHLVDSAGHHPCHCGPGPYHPYPGTHGGDHQQGQEGEQPAPAPERTRSDGRGDRRCPGYAGGQGA